MMTPRSTRVFYYGAESALECWTRLRVLFCFTSDSNITSFDSPVNRPIAPPLAYALLLLTGCESYQSRPLTQQAVRDAATLPPIDALQSRANELRHPLLAPVKIDFEHGLTPDSAAILAVIANPSLRIIRDQQSLASAQLLQAKLLPNPTLDFTLDPVTGGVTQGTVTGYNVGVNWEVTALISHEAKVAAAREGAESARLDVAWQEWQFAQAAKKSLFDLLVLRAEVAEAQDVDRRLSKDASLIRAGMATHEKTLLDLAAADSASQKAHADALSAQRDLRQQELVFKQAVGLPPDAKVTLQETALPSQLDLPSEQELNDGLAQRRIDLIALRHGYESQEQTLRVATLAQFPKIVLGFHQASDTTNVHSTGFGVSIDLPIFDQQQGAIAHAKATRQKLFDEYVARTIDARYAIAAALTDIRSLHEQIEAAEAALPMLEQLVREYQSALKQHNVDVRSYYAAQNDVAQKRIDILKLKQQLLDNRVALELAAGRYLPLPAATMPATTQTGGPATAEGH